MHWKLILLIAFVGLFSSIAYGQNQAETISWGPSEQYDTGGPNAVDMDNNGNCVDVHVGTDRLFYRVGKIDFNSQTISWGPSTEYDTGGPNAVAMDNNGNCVEVHVGTDRLFYRVGKIDFNSQTISWGPSTEYDTGGHKCSRHG